MNSLKFKKIKKVAGFTLVELMVTVAIVGLLLGVAYPSYSNYLTKSHRVKAQQILYILAKDMEQYHAEHQNYLGANIQKISHTQSIEHDHYRFELRELTEQSYQLAAVPKNSKDKQCGTLTLDQLGEEDVTGTAKFSDCWLT